MKIYGSNSGMIVSATSGKIIDPSKQANPQKNSALGKGISVLGKIGDILSAGNYMTANVVKKIVDKKDDSFRDVVSAGWKGLTLKEKNTYSDVLAEAGVKNKYVKAVGGFIGDIALDPTTYLSLGTAAVAKEIATKGGKVALTRAGEKFIANEAIKLGDKKLAQNVLEKMIEKSPKKAAQFIDKGGVKLAGKTLPGTAGINSVVAPANKTMQQAMGTVDKVVDKILSPVGKLTESVGKTVPATKIKETIGKIFDRDSLLRETPEVKEAAIKYYNTSRALKVKNAERVEAITSGLSKIEQENIARVAWTKDVSTLTEKELEAYKKIQGLLKSSSKAEKATGNLPNLIEGDYLPHVYKNKKKADEFFGFDTSSESAANQFAKQRKVSSYEQAVSAGLEPELNLEKMLKTRLNAASETIAKSNFYQEVKNTVGVRENVLQEEKVPYKKTYVEDKSYFEGKEGQKPLLLGEETASDYPIQFGTGKPGRKLKPETYVEKSKRIAAEIQQPSLRYVKKTEKTTEEGFKSQFKTIKNPELEGKDLVKVTGIKELEGTRIPRHVAEYITERVNTKSDGETLKALDKFTNFIKGSLTVNFPGFHWRNFKSNIMQNVQDVGWVKAANPFIAKTSFAVLDKADQEVLLAGEKYTAKELREKMLDLGVLQGAGYFDLSTDISRKNLGGRLGRFIENQARAQNFLANVELGMTFEQAAKHTSKFLFDYNNLSPFEEKVLKRVFPFYTWPSKNLGLYSKELLKNPGRIAMQFKLARAVAGTGEPISAEEYAVLPDWMKDQSIMKKSDDGKSYIYTGFGYPFEQALQLVTSPVGEMAFSLHPALKAVFTGITGYDLDNKKKVGEVTYKNAELLQYAPKSLQKAMGFTDNVYEKDDGTEYHEYSANPAWLWLLRQPPFSRIVTESNKVAKADDKTEAFKSILLGTQRTELNMDKFLKQKEIEYKNEISKDAVKKGWLKDNGFGKYYVPSNLKLDDATLSDVKGIAKMLNDVDFVGKKSRSNIPVQINQRKSYDMSGIQFGKTSKTPKYTGQSSKSSAKDRSVKLSPTSKKSSTKDVIKRIQGM